VDKTNGDIVLEEVNTNNTSLSSEMIDKFNHTFVG